MVAIKSRDLVNHEGRLALVIRTREMGAETDDAYRYLVADIVYLLDQPLELVGKYSPRTNQSITTIPAQTATVNTDTLTHVA